jgi:hypothetical protein
MEDFMKAAKRKKDNRSSKFFGFLKEKPDKENIEKKLKREKKTSGKNIHQRLVSVIERIEYIQNEGENKHDKYKYPTIYQIIGEVRKALIKEGLTLWIWTIEEKELEPGKTKSGTTMNRYKVILGARLTNSDNPNEYLESNYSGISFDVSDKAQSKAYTQAYKTMMKQLFQIETGDDARNEPDNVTPEETVIDITENMPDNVWQWFRDHGADSPSAERVLKWIYPHTQNNIVNWTEVENKQKFTDLPDDIKDRFKRCNWKKDRVYKFCNDKEWNHDIIMEELK